MAVSVESLTDILVLYLYEKTTFSFLLRVWQFAKNNLTLHFIYFFFCTRFKISYIFLEAYFQVCDNFWQLKVLYKWWKMLFYFTLKIFLVLEIFQIFFWIFGLAGKWFDKKAKLNFKIYDALFFFIRAILLEHEPHI